MGAQEPMVPLFDSSGKLMTQSQIRLSHLLWLALLLGRVRYFSSSASFKVCEQGSVIWRVSLKSKQDQETHTPVTG